MTTDKENERSERRKKMRFAIQRDLRYKLLEPSGVNSTGCGHTINMASGGVAFSAEDELKPGGLIELSISWPALLDENCPVALIIFGRLVRSDGQMSVCTVERYEYRTQARSVRPISIRRPDATLRRWLGAVRKDEIKARGPGRGAPEALIRRGSWALPW